MLYGAASLSATQPGVSIRARPRGRAMQMDAAVYYLSHNVSIRARPRGRAMPPIGAVEL